MERMPNDWRTTHGLSRLNRKNRPTHGLSRLNRKNRPVECAESYVEHHRRKVLTKILPKKYMYKKANWG
jgi:hypothetical protein